MENEVFDVDCDILERSYDTIVFDSGRAFYKGVLLPGPLEQVPPAPAPVPLRGRAAGQFTFPSWELFIGPGGRHYARLGRYVTAYEPGCPWQDIYDSIRAEQERTDR